MKILMMFLVLFITSCNDNDTTLPEEVDVPESQNPPIILDEPQEPVTDTTVIEAEDNKQTELTSQDIWYMDFSGNQEKLKRGSELNSVEPDAALMIKLINQQYPEREKPKLEYIKTVKDTLYINIKNDNYLTQRMGSAGSRAYLATATYNLTEIPGIKFINYKFKIGDHANPGVYTRKDFNDLLSDNN